MFRTKNWSGHVDTFAGVGPGTGWTGSTGERLNEKEKVGTEVMLRSMSHWVLIYYLTPSSCYFIFFFLNRPSLQFWGQSPNYCKRTSLLDSDWLNSTRPDDAGLEWLTTTGHRPLFTVLHQRLFRSKSIIGVTIYFVKLGSCQTRLNVMACFLICFIPPSTKHYITILSMFSWQCLLKYVQIQNIVIRLCFYIICVILIMQSVTSTPPLSVASLFYMLILMRLKSILFILLYIKTTFHQRALHPQIPGTFVSVRHYQTSVTSLFSVLVSSSRKCCL